MAERIQLGWIDYSNEHRNKVMAVLHALSAPEAVDEIGIGIIRDGFADILFPGTSTIQTRAKYFFIVPYILMEIEREKNITPRIIIDRLSKIELELIKTLNKNGAEGVIGRRAGNKLKRKPSSIYWNGLRTFGIFKYNNFSLDGYAKAVCSIKENKNGVNKFGHEEKGVKSDDVDALQGDILGGFWRCLLPKENWKEDICIDLTYEEAKYLRERIIKAETSKDSLFAFILKNDYKEILANDEFDAIGDLLPLPDNIKIDYEMAKKFGQFIYGANIRYNVILSNSKNQIALKEWETWLDSSFVKNEFVDYYFYQVVKRLKIGNGKLIRFLSRWKEKVIKGNMDEIDNLIIEREIELKGKERSKLKNSKAYVYKEGDWLGGESLQYRFRNAKRLIADIYSGLEGKND
jgi:hypothetical protein